MFMYLIFDEKFIIYKHKYYYFKFISEEWSDEV